jgi:hypothetical protein
MNGVHAAVGRVPDDERTAVLSRDDLRLPWADPRLLTAARGVSIIERRSR